MIKQLVSRFIKDNEGVAIIEGVLVLPIAIFLFIGIFETGQMLLLNQKGYAASHMVADLLARQPTLDQDDLAEAVAAGKMVMEPFDPEQMEINIVGVQFDDEGGATRLWQKAYPNDASDPDLYKKAEGMGKIDDETILEDEGAIIVSVAYDYDPLFPNVKIGSGDSVFSLFEMNEYTILRGRVNSCISLNDGGTPYNC